LQNHESTDKHKNTEVGGNPVLVPLLTQYNIPAHDSRVRAWVIGYHGVWVWIRAPNPRDYGYANSGSGEWRTLIFQTKHFMSVLLYVAPIGMQ